MDLINKKCVPCEGGTDPFDDEKIASMLPVIEGWSLKNGHLCKEYQFKNFAINMKFINRVADLAEEEGHHPDFCVHYNKVDFEIWTHAIEGISENDFILAAKINSVEMD
jgi:4a-hydroxytetrahydrobiopterin dehydratase